MSINKQDTNMSEYIPNKPTSQMDVYKVKELALPILRMILTDDNYRPADYANNPATVELGLLFSNPYAYYAGLETIINDPVMYDLLKAKEHQQIIDTPAYKLMIEELEAVSDHGYLPIKKDGNVNMYLIWKELLPTDGGFKIGIPDAIKDFVAKSTLTGSDAKPSSTLKANAQAILSEFDSLGTPETRRYVDLMALPRKAVDTSSKLSVESVMEGYVPVPVEGTYGSDAFLLNQRYDISATGKQVDSISEACDLAASLHIGQIDSIIDALPIHPNTDKLELLLELERVLFPHLYEPNNHYPDTFTIYQTLRHRRSWDKNPEGGMTVNFDEPLILTSNPLLKISKAV